MTTATSAHGTLLSVRRDTVKPISYIPIAELSNIVFTVEGDSIDVTSHDSDGKWREYIAGLKSVTITFTGNFLPGSTTHSMDTEIGVFGLFDIGRIKRFKVQWSDVDTTIFKQECFVKDITITANLQEQLIISGTLRGTGVFNNLLVYDEPWDYVPMYTEPWEFSDSVVPYSIYTEEWDYLAIFTPTFRYTEEWES
jgi:predicted secreted protein